jgi:hypothetical protein
MYRNRIAIDIAKAVFQVAESARLGEVTAHKRLPRAAFVRYLKAIPAPTA